MHLGLNWLNAAPFFILRTLLTYPTYTNLRVRNANFNISPPYYPSSFRSPFPFPFPPSALLPLLLLLSIALPPFASPFPSPFISFLCEFSLQMFSAPYSEFGWKIRFERSQGPH